MLASAHGRKAAPLFAFTRGRGPTSAFASAHGRKAASVFAITHGRGSASMLASTRGLALVLASILALTFALTMAMTAPREALAAEGDLKVVEAMGEGLSGSAATGFTLYVRDGDTATITLKLRNETAGDLKYVSIADASTYEEGGETVEPFSFPPFSSTGAIGNDAKNAQYSKDTRQTSATAMAGYAGFTINPGVTAQINMKVSAGNLPTGEYTWYIQLGRERFDYELDTQGTSSTSDGTWNYTGSTVEEMYTARIPITVVVYNQDGAALKVGTADGGLSSPDAISPVTAAGIDFGTVNLQTDDTSVLKGSQTIYVINDNTPNRFTDDYGVNTSIKVSFGGEATTADVSGDNFSPFTWGNGTLYDANWAPLAPITQEGNTVSMNHAEYSVFFDAADLIAGTYTGNLIMYTTPRKVAINGASGSGAGSGSGGVIADDASQAAGTYRIPFRITLEGENNRLAPRAASLSANAKSDAVELTWASSDSSVAYYVYRREGSESKANPDTWTADDWARYERLGYNPISAKSSDNGAGSYLYVDSTAKNGTTYSYVVMAGDPFRGYASTPASATPDPSKPTRVLAPARFAAGDEVGGVTLTWEMDEYYGGSAFDGAGTVDHFNVYRDGVLVSQVYQSAVTATVDTWSGVRTCGWETFVETPVAGQPYTFTVAAVDASGVEGYFTDPELAMGLPEASRIVGHDAEYYQYYTDDDVEDVPAIAFTMKMLQDGGVTDQLTFWRADGTAAPDTSAAPLAVVAKNYTYGTGEYDFVDTSVAPGRVYTYTVRATDYDGTESDLYTFTAVAVEDVNFGTNDVEWNVAEGKKAQMTWYSDYRYVEDDEGYGDWEYCGTYKVYRNNVLMSAPTLSDGTYTFENDPGADGTYVYRVDKVYRVNGTDYTIRGRDFTFVRNTAAADESAFLKPPSAPELSVRLSDGHPILEWAPGEASEGGAGSTGAGAAGAGAGAGASAAGGPVEGYHIYRMDAGAYVQGGRMVETSNWSGTYLEYRAWGNNRYLTIQDAATTSFADGFDGDYLGDCMLGRMQSLSWQEDSCPHVYWITANNAAGESARSATFTFGFPGMEDAGGYEQVITPTTPATDAPMAPTITDMWVDWEDQSQTFGSEWDRWPGGHVRVVWEDAVGGGAIDKWNIHTDGTHHVWSEDESETLTFAEALNDPALKQGGLDLDRASIDAKVGSDGDIGRTVSMTVEAENSAGAAKSAVASIDILSFPRMRVKPDNGAVKVEWTGLLEDATTTVTGWEIWRRAQYGVWERVKEYGTSDLVGLTYAATDKNGTQSYAWVDEGVDNGWAYQYKVVAKCADGIDRPSVVNEATPERTATIEAPDAPLNPHADVVNGEVVFSWEPATTGGTPKYYQVVYELRDSSGNPYWTGAPHSVTAPSTTDVWAPEAAGTYRWFVYAYNYVDGEEVPDRPSESQIANFDALSEAEQLTALYPSRSEIMSVTLDADDVAAQASGYPKKPSVSAVAGENQVTLNWTLEGAGAAPTYFTIERQLDSESGTAPEIARVPATGTSWSYVDDTAEPGVRYCYTVTARAASSGNFARAEVYARATGTTRDAQVAAQVEALIDGLPAPDALTVGDAEAVAAVQEVWETLSAKQRSLVSADRAQKLADCVQTIAELELLERYRDVVEPVQALINVLPAADAVALGDEAAIVAAREAYDGLYPLEAKRLVDASRLFAAEERLRDLKYNLARAEVATTGEYAIGADAPRPAVAVSMNGAALSGGNLVDGNLVGGDFRVVGYVAQDAETLEGATVVGAITTPGYYKAVVEGRDPYFGRVMGATAFRAYDVNDDLAYATFAVEGAGGSGGSGGAGGIVATEGGATAVFNGMAQEPAFDVMLYGNALTAGQDYTLGDWQAVDSETGARTPVGSEGMVNAGTYVAAVQSAGFFIGETEFTFVVTPLDIADASVSAKVNPTSMSYTGEALEPEVSLALTAGGTGAGSGSGGSGSGSGGGATETPLVVDTDYALVFTNNTAIGAGQAVVTGMGNFKGSRTVPFKITEPQADLASAAAYTALLQELQLALATAQASNDAAAISAAQEAYNTARNLSDTEIVVGDYAYSGGAIVPKVVVRKTYGDATHAVETYDLEPGVHYETYIPEGADNVNAGEGKARVGVRPVGGEGLTTSLTIQSNAASFDIYPVDIAGVDVTLASPVVYTGLVAQPAFTVLLNEYELVENQDYTMEVTGVAAGTAHAVLRAAGSTGSGDGSGSGTGSGSGSAGDGGTGSGSGDASTALSGNFTGMKDVAFTILPATLTATYAGETVVFGTQPALAVDVVGFVNGETPASLGTSYTAPTVKAPSLVAGKSYELAPSGGVAPNYAFRYVSGTLNVTKIDISGASVALSQTSFTYDGTAKEPGVTVTLGGTTLSAPGDYTVEYSANTGVGTATVTVTGAGNYTGSATATFTINAAPVVKRTVSFDAGGGTGSMAPVQVDDGARYTLPTCAFTAPSGKEFDRWSVGAAGAQVTVTGDLVVRAIWKDVATPAPTPKDVTWTRLEGNTRYDTMASIVKEGFPGKCDWAVVATGGNFPDALAASALAGYRGCPVVLTDSASLSPQARAQLTRLGVKNVYIMGGDAAVSAAVERQVKGLNGGVKVARVAGATRQDTSVRAMNIVKGASDTVIVATGAGYADTLSIGPWSYATRSPIVLTGGDGTLTSAEVSAIKKAGYKRYVIVGGTAVVSAKVDAQLAGLRKVTRLGGADRYETSKLIADFSLKNGLTARTVAVATGKNYPDALAGAALQGASASIMVLVADAKSPSLSAVSANAAAIERGYVLGGTAALPDSLMSRLRSMTAKASAAAAADDAAPDALTAGSANL